MKLQLQSGVDELIEIEKDRPNSGDSAEEPRRSLLHIHRLSLSIRRSVGDPLVSRHIRNMVTAGTETKLGALGLPARQTEELATFVSRYIRYPLGPRAAFAMELGARAVAALDLFGETGAGTLSDFILPAFAQIAVPSIRHRLKLKLGWERTYVPPEGASATARPEDLLLQHFIMLCAPEEAGYRDLIKSSLLHRQPNLGGAAIPNDLDNLPISIAALESILFGTSQSLPSEGLGAHLRRRHGQSLGFRSIAATS